MENASKALLIAGEILIAVMILTLATILIFHVRQVPEAYDTEMSAQQIEKFNYHFTKYAGRTDLTAQEVLTTINYAQEYNRQVEDTNLYIIVNVSYYGSTNVADPNVPVNVFDAVAFLKKYDYDKNSDGSIKFEDETLPDGTIVTKPKKIKFKISTTSGIEYVTEGLNRGMVKKVIFQTN